MDSKPRSLKMRIGKFLLGLFGLGCLILTSSGAAIILGSSVDALLAIYEGAGIVLGICAGIAFSMLLMVLGWTE